MLLASAAAALLNANSTLYIMLINIYREMKTNSWYYIKQNWKYELFPVALICFNSDNLGVCMVGWEMSL